MMNTTRRSTNVDAASGLSATGEDNDDRNGDSSNGRSSVSPSPSPSPPPSFAVDRNGAGDESGVSLTWGPQVDSTGGGSRGGGDGGDDDDDDDDDDNSGRTKKARY